MTLTVTGPGGTSTAVRPVTVTPGEGITAVEEVTTSVVATFSLSQNSPNPFNPSTTIRFALPTPGAVRLTIYDLRGQRIRSLPNGYRPAGQYRVTWDGRNGEGQEVARGVNFYRLEAVDRGFMETKRMLLVR
ncbi:MAG: hypothetical protein HY709_08435 [Candidatus Latescibacteria bacterium]|nr:hypothetical protein [Candidatus Latescibacterota bacterium]